MMESSILITGGAGFIGSNFIRTWLAEAGACVVNVDKRTYAGGSRSLSGIAADRHRFVSGDIADRALIGKLLDEHRPCGVINFAAETHVDRSILFPLDFVQANVLGTVNLLEEVRRYWGSLSDSSKAGFRFLQVSTDEVYGSLAADQPPWDEATPVAPNSPYSASKAASDHFVRAYYQTYGLPTQIARCCNNYGPYQYPEKLIPLVIVNALRERPLPIYGDGRQIRDWLFVGDHCAALRHIVTAGRPGEIYNISARAERTNLNVVKTLCELLDEARPRSSGNYADLLSHVADRPGHDRRYAIDAGKLVRELGWRPIETFESGLRKTVKWYLDNVEWVASTTAGEKYADWLEANYQSRRTL
jgi:dTDP-glucose 4,6-dehydratase